MSEHQLARADVDAVDQEPAGAFVTQVVPVQVDLSELLTISAGTLLFSRDLVAVTNNGR